MFKKFFLIIFSTLCILSSIDKVFANDKHLLFQESTINALLNGIYDGNMSFKELRKHGDFGLGTFNALNGEMILLNGNFYQIKSNGRVYPVNPTAKTPFATVTFFKSDKSFNLKNIKSSNQLCELLDKEIPTKNIFYAIKIQGDFKYIKTRSVPMQKKPYPPLVDVTKTQPTFEFNNIKGTLVGFRVPEYMNKVNVPNYHFHFISNDKKVGGHLLECDMDFVNAQIEKINNFSISLPEQKDFYNKDISTEKQKELEQAEK